MEFTKNQAKALDICIQRFREGQRYTTISGYAGSGKTTILRYIIEALGQLGVNPYTNVAYCAYTGKAAQVLKNKGCQNAQTAHRLLYDSVPLHNGGFKHIPKIVLPYKVIVVDECSMLPNSMLKVLLNHNVYIIFSGDPGQLPPINPKEANTLLAAPHIFLDEITRQALDSGIIRLSMLIREGQSFNNFESNDAKIFSKNEFVTGHLEWADQILCATNNTRISINNECRRLRGYTKPIEEGEKIVCLSNHWDIVNSQGYALTNGCIGTLSNIFDSRVAYPFYMGVPNNRIDTVIGNFTTEFGEEFGSLEMERFCIENGTSEIAPELKYKICGNPKYRDSYPLDFTYAYAMTCHRAQGSQWDNVLVIEENFPFSKEDHIKWLYTACTRPSSKLVLIHK